MYLSNTTEKLQIVLAGAVTTTDSTYAEDAASASADPGLFILGVRNDANAVVTSANGDYSQISVNDKGAIAIQDGGNSITVDATSLPLPTGAATETTLSALNTKFTSVTRTPSLTRATGSGTVAAGARSISVYNSGTAAGSILGVASNILPGEAFDFSAGGEDDVLGSFAYNATGTTLVITTIV